MTHTVGGVGEVNRPYAVAFRSSNGDRHNRPAIRSALRDRILQRFRQSGLLLYC
jgi:hypothetical protein